MLCGDGSLLSVSLDERGGARDKARSDPFFDPETDPIQEDGVRVGDAWLFVSYASLVYSVDARGDALRFHKPWPLMSDAERAAGWRTGCMQLVAGHAARGELYVAMHLGRSPRTTPTPRSGSTISSAGNRSGASSPNAGARRRPGRPSDRAASRLALLRHRGVGRFPARA
jgi:hypothetical protein